MPRQWSKSSSWTRSLPQITTTNDGFGCSSLGFAWQWSATTLKNFANASLHPPPTCQLQKNGSSQFRRSRLLYKLKRRSRPFWRKWRRRPNSKRLSLPWTHSMALSTTNLQTERILTLVLRTLKKQRGNRNYHLLLIPFWVCIIFLKKSTRSEVENKEKILFSSQQKVATTRGCCIPSTKKASRRVQCAIWMEASRGYCHESNKTWTKRWWKNWNNCRKTMRASESRWTHISIKTRFWPRDWKNWRLFNTTIRASSKMRRKWSKNVPKSHKFKKK